ncbi:MAG TPA: ABC transporter permease [Acidimicrobiia bacterium]|jgi:ABC-2 type transport system permease protein
MSARPVEAPPRPAPPRRSPAGWRIVARKELADHLLSARFAVLLVVIGLTGVAAVYAAASAIRDIAPDASGSPALFLKLFTVTADPIPFSFVQFVTFLGPLLGIAFGFDAVNGERADGTLPRLVSQPIYRDDVVNGKYVAGLGVISAILIFVLAIVAGFGIVRLGIVPTGSEVARMVVWLVGAIVYVGVWLALAILCSVLTKKASTAALFAIAAWLVFTLFFGLITNIVADAISPEGATTGEVLDNIKMEQALNRISPNTLFDESTAALLDPQVRTLGVVTFEQLDRAVVSELSIVQSLLLVWPQLTGLIALTTVLFAASYLAFMRQEVRA